jgi:hypothetical protein
MRSLRIFMTAALVAGLFLVSGCVDQGAAGDEGYESDQSVVDPVDSESDWWGVEDDSESDDDAIDAADLEDAGSSTTDTTASADADEDEILIVGDASKAVEPSDSFEVDFTASPIGVGYEYSWVVLDKPDWVTKGEDGTYNQKLYLSVEEGDIPEEAEGQEFTMTIAATDTEGAGESATIEFVLSVAEVVEPEPEPEPDLCAEAPRLMIKSVRNVAEDATVNCDDTDQDGLCDDDEHMIDGTIQGTLEQEYEITFEVQGGKAPYNWVVASEVEDSEHCRRLHHFDSELSVLPYKGEGKEQLAWMLYEQHTPDDSPSCSSVKPSSDGDTCTYYYPKEGKTCDDDEYAVKAVTRSNNWTTDDFVYDSEGPDIHIFSEGGKTEGKTLTIRGKLEYFGPLPISRLPKDGGKDDFSMVPYERLTVTVNDSCEPKVMNCGEHGITEVRASTKAMRIGIKYPEDERVEDLTFKMGHGPTAAFDQVSVYFADEPVFTFNASEKALGGSTVYRVLDVECDYYDYICITEKGVGPKAGSTDPDYEYIKEISRMLAVFQGRGPHESSGAGCYGDGQCIIDDFDLRWLRFDSRYMRAQWTDGLGYYDDEIGENFFTSAEMYKQLTGDKMSPGNNGSLSGGQPYRFHRRELPDYK